MTQRSALTVAIASLLAFGVWYAPRLHPSVLGYSPVQRQQPVLSARQPVAAAVFDPQDGLASGWMDFGYSTHTLAKGAAIAIDLANHGGLILAHPGQLDAYGGLLVTYRAPEGYGDFLEVQLQRTSGEALARIPIARSAGAQVDDGFVDVWLPMEILNPRGESFARIMFFATRDVGHQQVFIRRVAFTAQAPAPTRRASFVLDCGASAGHEISPLIYGLAGDEDSMWAMSPTARRWGGNPSSRYNWQLNTWNLTNDWFFRNNGDPKGSYERFLDGNRQHGVKTALTIPMLGWVAKDTTSYSFPVSVFGPQQTTAPDGPDAGNGVGRDGKPVRPGPPTRTSVASTPATIAEWVRQIRSRDTDGGRSVDEYILDNEPMLWNATHRDVHPDPATYDELLEKTLAYGTAIRRADPGAAIAGPAAWGWMEYLYSARDVAAGAALRPDRRLHGDQPLLPWYLRKVRDYEQQSGIKILDVVDIHFYSMAPGVGIATGGQTDPATAALRIRSTRSLWDPTYTDESWINEKMRVLPLIREWIAQNHPGLGISLGEWNFGAETHMSGGLAAAEALGRFGTEGITSAYYWTSPKDRSPAYWAFRAFRNFDGAGAHFLNWSVPVKSDGTLTSLFVSRDDAGHFVAVLLNFDPRAPLSAQITSGCAGASQTGGVTYTGGDGGFSKIDVSAAQSSVQVDVAPYSMTVLSWTASTPPR